MECVVREIPIQYDVFGRGRPVVILHGSGLDGRCMQACLEPVLSDRDGWSRIYPDLPGQGKTPGPDWIKNNDQMLEVVVEFIETLIPGQNFAIVGYSYGGYLARGVAHHLFSKVDGLLLWAPATYPRSERKLPQRVVRITNERIAGELRSEAEKDVFSALVFQTKEAMDVARANIARALEISDERFLGRVVDTKFSFDLTSQRFDRPTLILCGRQDSSVGFQDAYDILNDYPMGTIVIIDGAGHILGFTEGRRLFTASVDSWLDNLEHSQ